MNFDPQKFFTGLMDFFLILLLGALRTWRMMGEASPVVLRDRYAQLAGAEAWAASPSAAPITQSGCNKDVCLPRRRRKGETQHA